MLLREGARWHAILAGFVVAVGVLLAQEPNLDDAIAAYREGRTGDVETMLSAYLQKHPADPTALALMGAALDTAQRFTEAEPYYERALKAAPKSSQVLNNAANHYLATGDRLRARELFQRTVAIEPAHRNANLQLAQMSVDDKRGAQAVTYLARVPVGPTPEPAVELLRARALALAGRCSESGRTLAAFEADPRSDASVHFAIGMSMADCKLYDQAEKSFSLALDAEPRNFDILYNLGLAAFRAGHIERAQSVLEIALREKPDDPDTLFALSEVNMQRGEHVRAAALLNHAQKVAPDRADIILLLAQVSAQLAFYEDSAAAYDKYLKLKPEDDVARRERGFDLARVNQQKRALEDLEWYVARHPQDGVGYFELAIAHVFDDRGEALALLDKAIALDPTVYQARYTRALLKIEDDHAAAAIPDLELYVQKQPKDARGLAHLGQAYLAANRDADAVRVLERAQSIEPDSALVLVHYRRALERLGRKQEASAVLARLRDSGNRSDALQHRAGLIDYLSLSPIEQRVRYLDNLRQQSAADPSNVRLKLELGRQLLIDGKRQDAVDLFRALPVDSLEPDLLIRCGRTLTAFQNFAEAQPFFERAVAAAREDARIDLAICIFHIQGATQALQELDKTSGDHRKGDYYLLRAQILDSEGKVPEAAESLNRGIRAAPTRAPLYHEAASFLLKHRLYREASEMLAQASRLVPDDRELLLAQVLTLNLLHRTDDSEKLLSKIQSRWPEWDRPYLLKGILLQTQRESAEARQVLETAIALGADTPEAYYYQALAIMDSAPDEIDAAQGAISRALALTSGDPYIWLLAGKIALARKEYDTAISRLHEATRLAPMLVPAHYALRDAYGAIGDERKSRDELEAIKSISAKTEGTGDAPLAMDDILFTVRPPGKGYL